MQAQIDVKNVGIKYMLRMQAQIDVKNVGIKYMLRMQESNMRKK